MVNTKRYEKRKIILLDADVIHLNIVQRQLILTFYSSPLFFVVLISTVYLTLFSPIDSVKSNQNNHGCKLCQIFTHHYSEIIEMISYIYESFNKCEIFLDAAWLVVGKYLLEKTLTA